MIDISKGRYWDLPLSLVSGCTPCSPGCDHCWSAGITHRFKDGLTLRGEGQRNGQFNGQIIIHPERLSIPLKRRKPTVFAVWNDLFHEDVPSDFASDTIIKIEDDYKKHTFLILTKRPHRMLDQMRGYHEVDNIYFGLTVCNQQEADEKIPVFLQVPGKKFLSIEPALSNISLWETYLNVKWVEYFDVVIMGAETGPGARSMDQEWARTVRDECEVTGTPFFLKQIDKKHNRILDGRTHDDLPWGKRIMELSNRLEN